ncbi:MAG: type I DNA topoisomerase [Candidatus Dormibacteraeota bacterium]|nr:type I DNA topoisomerase [Candidatus Dormibacteraeota bacterium]
MPARTLIIVESPSKARTLSKFLGTKYDVKASMGHVVDLPRSKLGIDVEQDFAPDYTVIKGKEKQLAELKTAAKKSGRVLLAADPDREGEAIAWHIANQLKLPDPERIVFREVTQPAVEAALQQPRPIDRNLVDAYQARRAIDRLLGYKLSPLLWRKIRKGLSAGRVQSVALRLVCDREDEIDSFVPRESWTLDAVLETRAKDRFTARYQGQGEAPKRRRGAVAEDDDDRSGLSDEAATQRVLAELQGAEFQVASVERRRVRRNPPQPYTTSTMQQDASSQLRFSPTKTMRVAQQLYEGVDLGPAGATGLITYMRTDSVRVSQLAIDQARDYVSANFGKSYLGTAAAGKRSSKSAVPSQDAHEAVRPTAAERSPEAVAEYLTADQLRLYRLVWRRFMASQMSPAEFDSTRVEVTAAGHRFRATGSQLVFDGFLKVSGGDDRQDELLPAVAAGDPLALLDLHPEQHFSQPPARYTEASLVKEMEERGIGRPSTYAPTVELIQTRAYVRQLERRLHPAPLGRAVNEALTTQFPAVVDFGFTAELEKRLDAVETGEAAWVPVVRSWYEPFAKVLDEAQESMPRVKIQAQPAGEDCPRCGAELVVRSGRFGDFVGCSRYPECDYIQGKEDKLPPEEIGEACPQCGKPLVRRNSRRGPFIGCSAYPKCKYVRSEAAPDGTTRPARPAAEPVGEKCPECGQDLVKRMGRFGPFVSCSGYPKCRYRPPRVATETAADSAAAPVAARRTVRRQPGRKRTDRQPVA